MARDASGALSRRFLNIVRTGNLDLLKKFAEQLGEGKNLSKTVEEIKDASKRGALHYAAIEGHAEICKYLLEDLKLQIDSRDDDGQTALIHAARLRRTATAKYLVDHGADPTIVDSNVGATTLHYSAGIVFVPGDIELLEHLLSKGINPDLESFGGTPLVWAAGHAAAVAILLKYGANPNVKTDDGLNPLIFSVSAGSLECIKLLIQAGAKVNFSLGGKTPLHIAAENGSLELINSLLKAGADPNVSYKDGVKPIQIAAARGKRGAVEILFPVTSKIDTIDGILEYMQSESKNQQSIKCNMQGELVNGKESNGLKDVVSREQNIPEVSPEAIKRAAESRARGDEAFKRNDHYTAIDSYTQAIDLIPSVATLLLNRILCWMRLGQAEHALTDAKACRVLRPDWAKACYMEGAALRLLQKFEEAANAFYEGLTIDPENRELTNTFGSSHCL